MRYAMLHAAVLHPIELSVFEGRTTVEWSDLCRRGAIEDRFAIFLLWGPAPTPLGILWAFISRVGNVADLTWRWVSDSVDPATGWTSLTNGAGEWTQSQGCSELRLTTEPQRRPPAEATPGFVRAGTAVDARRHVYTKRLTA